MTFVLEVFSGSGSRLYGPFDKADQAVRYAARQFTFGGGANYVIRPVHEE